MNAPRVVGLSAVLFAACSAPCEQQARRPDEFCQKLDAGVPQPNQPFVLTALAYGVKGPCTVAVNGNSISVLIHNDACSSTSSGSGAPMPPNLLPSSCPVPALDAGTYTLEGNPFTLPDAGLDPCP